MSIREKIRARSAAYLEDGEQYQGGFVGIAGMSPWAYSLFGAFLAFFATMMIVVATDRAILIMRAGKLTTATPKELLARLPRDTPLGDPRGVWGRILEGTDVEMYVHRRFFDDVRSLQRPAR